LRSTEAPFALDQSSVAAVSTALIGLVVLSWLALRPASAPPAQQADAPAAVFSAARTRPAVALLAQAARPAGSDANRRARDYLVQRLRAMDVETEVQSGYAQQERRLPGGASQVSAGLAHNIVARIPGRARGPALLVAAHYDGDYATPVAAMLETVRALRHGAPLANDVIVLFADAELAGSLGARAFAQQHRWAPKVGLVLQFDGAGNGGPLMLTGTRGGDGRLVAGWSAAAPRAQGSSALALLASGAPGLRQGAPLDAIGGAGMRFATIEGEHARQPADGAMQHTGDTMLALARHFGNTPLGAIAAPDRLHFDLPLAGQVHYAIAYVWPLTRLVGLMVLIACCIAVKRSGVPAGKLITGATAFFALTAALALAAVSVWSGAGAAHDCWLLLAFIALGGAVFIECQRLLLKAIGIPAALLGALLVMLAVLLGVSWQLPQLSYLLAWPMVFALLAYGALQAPPLAALSGGARLAILGAGSVPAVLLFAPLLRQMTTLFAFQRSLVLIVALALMLGLATAPLAALRRRFVAPLLLLVCGAALLAAGRAPLPAPAAAPRTYLKDAASWNAWWLTPAGSPAGGARPLRELTGLAGDERWVRPAPASSVEYPELLALRDELRHGRRLIAFTVRARNASPTLEVRVEGAPTLRAKLDGKLLTERRATLWTARLHGTAGRAHRFELELAPGNITRVFVQESKSGLPHGAGAAGLTIAADMFVFR
jgi:hypothetical protein